MKKILLVVGFTAALVILSAPARAQAPYGYDPNGAYVDPQANDPNYQLHVIHYQLYLQQYGYYDPYPVYFGAPQIFVPTAPVVAAPGVAVRGAVNRPAPALRSAIPVVTRR